MGGQKIIGQTLSANPSQLKAMASTVGTASVISLQFLAPTPEGSTIWVTHVQTDTEEWAWKLLDKLVIKYPRRKWRWIRTIEDVKYPQI